MFCNTKLFIDNEKDSDDKHKYTYYKEYTVLEKKYKYSFRTFKF